MSELRSELRAAVTTSQQQQRQLEALDTHTTAAQTEVQRVAQHRDQLERMFAELYQAAMVHDEQRAQSFGATQAQQEGLVVAAINSALERQKAVADGLVSNMRSEMQEGFAQLYAETAACRQLQAEVRTCREEAVQWQNEYADLAMGMEDTTETVALCDAPWIDVSAAASRAAEPQGAPWSFGPASTPGAASSGAPAIMPSSPVPTYSMCCGSSVHAAEGLKLPAKAPGKAASAVHGAGGYGGPASLLPALPPSPPVAKAAPPVPKPATFPTMDRPPAGPSPPGPAVGTSPPAFAFGGKEPTTTTKGVWVSHGPSNSQRGRLRWCGVWLLHHHTMTSRKLHGLTK